MDKNFFIKKAINDAVKKHGLSYDQFYIQCGASPNAFRTYFKNNRAVSDSMIQQLSTSKHLNLSHSDLLFLRFKGEHLQLDEKALKNSEFREVPIPDYTYRVPCLGKVTAGSLSLHEEMEDTVYYAWDWIPEGKRCFCLEVVGDSMEPDIKNGSLVLVSESSKIYPGGTFVIQTSDYQTTLKYIEISEDGLYLIPANKTHKPIPLQFSDVDKIYEVHEIKYRPAKGKRR